MNLLGAVLYDPTTAAGLGTAASAMAAFDTTNARITFVVPPSGMVRVVIQCTIHGATTFSQILLGVLQSATVKGKVAPVGSMNGTALATTLMTQTADFVVTGLVAGASLTWDAAWGIETFVASSLIKYGGPANATANNDFGALIFQIWDPCPVYTPTSATAPTTTVQDKLVTEKTAVDAIKTKTDFLPSATAGAAGGVFIAGTNAATTITTSLTTTFTGNLTGSAASVTGAVGSVTGAVGSVTGAVGSVTGLTASNLDAAISSRMATFVYTVPPTVALIRAEMDSNSTKLANLDATTSSRLASGSYTAPDNASVAAIKLKTDSLTFTVAAKLDVNVLVVNGVTLIGDGVTTPMHG